MRKLWSTRIPLSLVLVGAALIGAAFVVVGGAVAVQTPQAAESSAAPPPRAPVTAAVERVVLTEKLVTRGSVRAAGAVPYHLASGVGGGARHEMMVEVGDSVDAGDAVARVDSRPVMLLVGDEQLGADIGPTSTGRDVLRLQAGLRGIGLQVPDDELGRVGPSTQRAIAELYSRAGFPAGTTADEVAGAGGSIGAASLETKLAGLRRAVADAEASVTVARTAAAERPDAVAAAALHVADAERRVAAAEVARTNAIADASRPLDEDADDEAKQQAASALRDATIQGDTAVADARSQLTLAELQLRDARSSEVVAAATAEQQVLLAQSALTAARADLDDAERTDGIVIPRSELLFVPALPTTVLTAGTPDAAEPAASSGPLFTLRSGEFVVDVDVPAGMRVRAGAAGRADSDDGLMELSIAGVDGGTEFGIVEVLHGEPSVGASVRVTLSTPVTETPVVAVPLRAIEMDTEGSSTVNVLDGDDVRRVAVQPGRAGGGMIEVLHADGEPGSPLEEGERVIVS